MRRAPPIVLLLGGGDLATGVAARLWRSGFWLVVTEIPQPLAVRRLVSLAEAVYEGAVVVEELRGRRAEDLQSARSILDQGVIPILVDPTAEIWHELEPSAMVDARMIKSGPYLPLDSAEVTIGLGPGFEAGVNVHAVVETHRGHRLGRVFWEGAAQPDTGVPESVKGQDFERVLRAPIDGVFEAMAELGSLVTEGTRLAEVGGTPLIAPFDGALRGLLHGGIEIEAGSKVGDLDPQQDLSLCNLISDKSLAIGGGVLEALLTRPSIRSQLGASSEYR